MTAVVVARRQLHGQEHRVRLFVDGHLCPHARVAGVGPRIFFPRVVAELAGLRNRVEDPQPLAGARVVAADESFFVNAALRRSAGQVRGADDDDVLGDDRRRVQTDFTRHRIDFLVVVHFQIDDAVLAEPFDRHARLRVERDHAVAGRHVHDPRILSSSAVGPVREPASRELTRRRLAALPLVLAVHPQQLAGGRVERDDGAARAGGRVENAVDHQRRPLQIELGTRSEEIRLEAPGDLEGLEVVLVNLIERRVTRARQIAAVGPPFARFRFHLT